MSERTAEDIPEKGLPSLAEQYAGEDRSRSCHTGQRKEGNDDQHERQSKRRKMRKLTFCLPQMDAAVTTNGSLRANSKPEVKMDESKDNQSQARVVIRLKSGEDEFYPEFVHQVFDFKETEKPPVPEEGSAEHKEANIADAEPEEVSVVFSLGEKEWEYDADYEAAACVTPSVNREANTKVIMLTYSQLWNPRFEGVERTGLTSQDDCSDGKLMDLEANPSEKPTTQKDEEEMFRAVLEQSLVFPQYATVLPAAHVSTRSEDLETALSDFLLRNRHQQGTKELFRGGQPYYLKRFDLDNPQTQLNVTSSPDHRAKIAGTEQGSKAGDHDLTEAFFRKVFLNRLQCMSTWFIETASLVDYSSPHFFYYLLYTVADIGQASSLVEENGCAKLVGFVLVYRFQNPLKGCIYRVCQQLVLPPFQKCGLGEALLAAVYAEALETTEVDTKDALVAVNEVNVEDPGEQFQLLREKVELKLCLQSKTFLHSVKTIAAAWSEIADCSKQNGIAQPMSYSKLFEKAKELVLSQQDLSQIKAETKVQTKQLQNLLEIGLLYKIHASINKAGETGSEAENRFQRLCEMYDIGLKTRIRGEYFPKDAQMSAIEATLKQGEDRAVLEAEEALRRMIGLKRVFGIIKSKRLNSIYRLEKCLSQSVSLCCSE